MTFNAFFINCLLRVGLLFGTVRLLAGFFSAGQGTGDDKREESKIICSRYGKLNLVASNPHTAELPLSLYFSSQLRRTSIRIIVAGAAALIAVGCAAHAVEPAATNERLTIEQLID